MCQAGKPDLQLGELLVDLFDAGAEVLNRAILHAQDQLGRTMKAALLHILEQLPQQPLGTSRLLLIRRGVSDGCHAVEISEPGGHVQ